MFNLVPHPDHPPEAARSVHVQIGRSTHGFRFYFFLLGDMDRIVVPAETDHPGRRDELWQTTCFEVFFRGSGQSYVEFNFSPSHDWASYAFDSYRKNPRQAPTTVDIDTDRFANLLTLEARLHADFTKCTGLCLSAVVEESDGRKSYWALGHPAGKPDFHHADCFAVRLADIG